jgi:tetratricopeptide (TPR) repeat protein
MRRVSVFLCLWLGAAVCAAGQGFDEWAAGAAAARRENRVPEALELYRKALAAKPDWLEGWWFEGTLSYTSYRYADGEAAFDRFVALDGTRALAWALLGLCEFETGHYDGALAHLERGLAPGGGLPPEVETGARFHYAMLLTRAAQFDRGRRELERFVRMAATQPLVVQAIGLNGLRQAMLPGDIPAARRELVEAAGRAACAWMSGDRATADREFGALLHEHADAAGVHRLYGSFLGETHPEEARAEFERELALDPQASAAHAMLALLALPEDPADALRQAEAAIAESPDDPLAQYADGQALVAAGKVAEGIERLNAALRLDPDNLVYHVALAGADATAGRDAAARQERAIAKAMAKEERAAY